MIQICVNSHIIPDQLISLTVVVHLQVFFCVVFYGLFHGLCYLTVILSCIGPTPYNSSRVHPLQLSTLSLNPVDCPGAIDNCPINNNNSKIVPSKSNDLSLIYPDQMVLPWQPDQSPETNSGDHVTMNKTVASTGDTHHHDRNSRRSIAGKAENTPRSATQICQAVNGCLAYVFLEPAARRKTQRVSWVVCWIVCIFQVGIR